jgi:CelD/BcsL family acetyltransferase involved in cellulose biosynthesis
LRSPGNLAHLLLMKELCVRGVRCYDFLSGAASYKDRLATGENRLVLLQCWRPTLRAIAHRTSRAVGRAVFWRQQPDGV